MKSSSVLCRFTCCVAICEYPYESRGHQRLNVSFSNTQPNLLRIRIDASWTRPFKASLQQRLSNPERTLFGDSRIHTVLSSDLWLSLTPAIGQRTDNHWISLAKTSTSSSSMIPKTSPRLSMNPLTDTLNMRLVVALYSVRRTVKFPSSPPSFAWMAKGASPFRRVFASTLDELVVVGRPEVLGGTREKERWTRGESSASTLSVRRAEDASRGVGRGTEIILYVA